PCTSRRRCRRRPRRSRGRDHHCRRSNRVIHRIRRLWLQAGRGRAIDAFRTSRGLLGSWVERVRQARFTPCAGMPRKARGKQGGAGVAWGAGAIGWGGKALGGGGEGGGAGAEGTALTRTHIRVPWPLPHARAVRREARPPPRGTLPSRSVRLAVRANVVVL